jgi:hypothetical protein
VEGAKIALIQFCVSPPKTDMENNVIVSDYQQMDRILKEERNYIIGLIKKIKAGGLFRTSTRSTSSLLLLLLLLLRRLLLLHLLLLLVLLLLLLLSFLLLHLLLHLHLPLTLLLRACI